MTYSILLFVTRKPTLSTEEFKDYWENKHIPLLKSLTGPHFPLRCTRRYLARIDRKGFGGPANRDHPLLVLRGNVDEFDYDGVAEMSWEDEKAFHKFYRAIWQTDVAVKLAADEESFMDVSRFKAVTVGETLETNREPAEPDILLKEEEI
jgi:hypothetical protein